ncbi:hypothetical protein J3L11_09960 [Shewanella sp. 4t3-1-2LB]|uniref:hypothetical protein n=1 Tax=Shewanella sp. 4t3-1-2LB TaxID=2817682 RepID=UPI001A99C9B6|nr:hypothetical protein [Shewanella sp. 4t3-1-2LB]MBO1271964.1 hypothetical protein [Shewanella sp. 4t3-1-2LB]
MTVMPRTVKNARINDLKQMILPEMVPDQLKILGVTLAHFYADTLANAQASEAGGIELIKLIERRTNLLLSRGNELYANKSHSSPSQIELVGQNINIFMTQCSALFKFVPPSLHQNEPIYQLIDRLVETAVYIGYYAGSNDTLSLTDRFTDSGYHATVTQTQKGGQAKARPINVLKDLVIEMANHLYLAPRFISTPKVMVVDAIYEVLQNYSSKGDNKKHPALVKFPNRVPEHNTLHKWLKPITKPTNTLKQPRPSISLVKAELSKAFTVQKITSKLNSQ